ncbi:MAG: glycosyltransferase family 2 protein [Pirellula sp.]|jgi:glycosyltransferase involved in cell wall biosynthesis|nr:glycosyltransferase family 2 protein [Pirellula sp.]
MQISVVIPAYNEAESLEGVVRNLREHLNSKGIEHEIVVVVDGATDDTESVARRVADAVLVHPVNCGYGRSLKTGIVAAKNEWIVITDADGTYPNDRIPDLLALMDRFDMVVGARSGSFYTGNTVKRYGRILFRWLSEYATGQRIPDINSGLRVFRRSQMIPFFPLINSGFSFTTTCTLSYLLNDLLVAYVPIDYFKRQGVSKVHHLRDSLRALQIIVEAILRCNPIKAFLLLATPFAVLGCLTGLLALVTMSGWAWMACVISLCTTGILLGLGFLAVALLPARHRHEHA